MVRVDVPDPPGTSDTLAGFNAATIVEIDVVLVRVTAPVSPVLFRTIPDLPLEPAVIVRDGELAAIVKFPVTMTVRKACRTIVPLVALMTIV